MSRTVYVVAIQDRKDRAPYAAVFEKAHRAWEYIRGLDRLSDADRDTIWKWGMVASESGLRVSLAETVVHEGEEDQ